MRREYGQKITSGLVVGVSCLSIIGGVYYFAETNDYEEHDLYMMFNSDKKWFGPKQETELQLMAEYVASVASPETPLLIDDAAAYGIMAHLPSLKGLILPLQKSFVTVIENPSLAAAYMCIAKRNNRLHNITVLNEYNILEMKDRIGLKPIRVFETENWIVYSIR